MTSLIQTLSAVSYVLNFLRTSELTLPCDFKEMELLRKEVDFYQIEPLIQCLGDPKPMLLYPTDTYEEVVELSSTRKLSKYSNPVAVIITQLTITTKVSGSKDMTLSVVILYLHNLICTALTRFQVKQLGSLCHKI